MNGRLKLKDGVSLDYESQKTGVVKVTVADGHGGSASVDVAYAVDDVNEAPIVQDDAANGRQGTAMVVDVLANDRDQDGGDAIRLASVALEQGQGSVRVVNGQLAYDPGTAYDGLNEGETATVVVTYVVADKQGLQTTGRAVTTVAGTNDAPTLTFTPAGARVVLSENAAGAVLGSVAVADVDAGDSTTVTLSDDRFELVGGRLKLKDGVSLDYESQKTGTVRVTATDRHGASTSVDVAYAVDNVNEGPTANADFATTREDNKVVVNVLGNDTDPDAGDVLTLKSVRLEQGLGTVSIVDGKLTFDPGTAYVGLRDGETAQVVVSYGAVDQGGLQTSSTATITVIGINQPPYLTFTAAGGRAALAENKTGAVLGTLTVVDPDIGDTHTYSISDSRFEVVNGQLKLKAGVSLDYETASSGVVTVKVTDRSGAWDSKDIAYTVDNMGEAVADTAATTEPAPIIIDVLANDVLPGQEGQLKVTTAKLVQGGGTLTVENNKLRFDPGTAFQYLKEGETADVVATYTVTDQNGSPTSATVTIKVTGINQAPVVAEFDPVAQRLGQPFSFALDMSKITDVDRGEALTLTVTLADGSPLPSWLSFDAVTGTFTSTTGRTTSGATRIKVTATDPHGASSTNVLTLAFYDGAVVMGTAAADAVDGRCGATVNGDWINGLGGDDSLRGSAGNDVIYGAAGNDRLEGEAGNDVVLGAAGDDFISDAEGANLLDGGSGNDTIYAFGGTGTVYGGAGNYRVDVCTTNLTVDGGSGDDVITVTLNSGYFVELTGGDGSDTVALHSCSGLVTITDFSAGPGGDRLDLRYMLESEYLDWDGQTNPFVAGRLRLVQVGADAEIRLSPRDGAPFQTIVILRNVDASMLVTENMGPPGYAFDPQGAPSQVLTLTVSAGGSGGSGADTIIGGMGINSLAGGAGADWLDGGAGNDSLWGECGNDVLIGGAGNDYLNGGNDDDTLYGNAGDDRLYAGTGSDTLYGGDGADYLTNWPDTPVGKTVLLDGGLGNDRFDLNAIRGEISIITGAGVDTVGLVRYFSANSLYDAAGAITIGDFTVGLGGDLLDLGFIASHLIGWDGATNPFDASLGFMRFRQVGADAVLEVDADGAAGSVFGWRQVYTLQNVDAATLTADNIVGGFDPQSGAVTGLTLTGTAGADNLHGASGQDVIRTLAGNDSVSGGSGDDFIDGGDGNDVLFGDSGNDTVLGGMGADYIYGGEGDDVVDGGEGDDTIRISAGRDTVNGGLGNDTVIIEGGSSLVDTGAGNDRVLFWDWSCDSQTISLGAGYDSLLLDVVRREDVDATITDFSVAEDFIDLSGLVNDYAQGWDGRANPFASGYLRLAQSGGDVLLQFDETGSGGAYVTQLRLQNVTISGLTSINFNPGYSPDGSGVVGLTIAGTASADTLTGGAGDDVMTGGDGNDTLTSSHGNDQIFGGAGNDVLSGEFGADTLSGGAGADILIGGGDSDLYLFGRGDGTDTVYNDAIPGDHDVVRFGAGIAIDQLWFKKVGLDLVVSIDGTADTVTVREWYLSSNNHVSAFETADGSRLLDSQVQNLVSAMAGMTSPPLGQLTLTTQQHQALDGVIAAAWQPSH